MVGVVDKNGCGRKNFHTRKAVQHPPTDTPLNIVIQLMGGMHGQIIGKACPTLLSASARVSLTAIYIA